MASGSVRLRTYRRDDLDAMYALDVICFAAAFRFSRRAMHRFAEAAGAITVIAEKEKELAGFVIVQMEGQGGYVVTLDVAPAWRRSGVARELMREAEDAVKQRGGAAMSLHVFVENDGAVRFYERSGYERLSVEKGFYGAGLDAAVYRKALPGAP